MFEKNTILIIIFILLALFYLVISIGAGKKSKQQQSSKITNYLKGVRILIIIIGIVSIILWTFM